MKSSAEIRQTFLEFFRGKGHEVVASSSLVPGNDPTLLFTNSGMVQFKDVFLGADKRSYTRATSSQRCVRAGGKHNDLDSVGYTARHHTFFEMLGNFSFGDYFKRDAIRHAWELLTEVYGLPADRLWVTVYHTDDEAHDIWAREVGVPVERIVRIGDNKGAPYASDNFWQMADTGPCGPCTEIFYDHGPEVAGGPPGSPDQDGDRYIEIWNLVFMQFDRAPDGTLSPLPKPCVDTGMGLERLAAVLQHVHSNYEIDLFQNLIRAAAAATGTQDIAEKSLRVIADHIRASSFLIVDGVLPSNEGRGYVLRRIIRRALRHGWKLGTRGAFFHTLVPALVREMGGAYPELSRSAQLVESVLKSEEDRFSDLLDRGMRRLSRLIAPEVAPLRALDERMGWDRQFGRHESSNGISFDAVIDLHGAPKGIELAVCDSGFLDHFRTLAHKMLSANEDLAERYSKLYAVVVSDNPDPNELTALRTFAEQTSALEVQVVWMTVKESEPYRVLSARAAFELFDTYGFPIDLTQDVCREAGYTVDMQGFQLELDAQRARSRAASGFVLRGRFSAELASSLPPTMFVGYDLLSVEDATVLAILVDGAGVSSIQSDCEATLLLDRTPFYAESGGQVGDSGVIYTQMGRFVVSDTQKLLGAFHGHVGVWNGQELSVGDRVSAIVDGERRQATVLNHSATHLLHAALRDVLGTHVTQKGSLVAPDRLRFDFSHFQPLTASELAEIEARVNRAVRGNAAADADEMAYDDAIGAGAMALFGEKYGERVRVVKMGGYSTELCGGTHVGRTGDIGLFKIIGESSVASGVRRIEAVTGAGALTFIAERERILGEAGKLVAANPSELVDKLKAIADRTRQLERELESLKAKAAGSALDSLLAGAEAIGELRVLAARIDGLDAKGLRDALDLARQKLGDAVVLLASGADGKVALVAGVSGVAAKAVKAGDLIGHVARQIGGRGGGRPDMAQGGGEDGPAVAAALAGVTAWVRERAAGTA